MMPDPACPVCSNLGAKPWGDTWFRCARRTCGHIYRFPQPDDEQLHQFYDVIYYPSAGEAQYENTSPYIAGQILSWFGSLEGKSLLDFGCGEGTFWQALPASAQSRYVGIEFDAVGANTARDLTGRPIHLSIEELEKSGSHGPFDLILMSQSIEHLRNPVATLKSLHSFGHADTRLLIATPNAGSLTALVKKSQWIQAQNPTHFHLFSQSSLETALRAAGWPASSTIRAPIRYREGEPLRDVVRHCIRTVGRDGNLTSMAAFRLIA